MLLKLDLSKYFDHLILEYIEKILLAFGFSWDWVSWILSLSYPHAFFMSWLMNLLPPPYSLLEVSVRETPSPPSFSSSWLKF